MRSAISSTSGMLWLIRITVIPRSRTRRIVSSTRPLCTTPERGGRLVHEHDAVGPGDRPCHRDALALAARQAGNGDGGILEVDAELGERRIAPGRASRACRAPRGGRARRRAGARGRGRRCRRRRGRARARGPGRRSRCPSSWLSCGLGHPQLAAVEEDLSGVGLGGAGQALHERALARAVVADERHDLARIGGEVRRAQRADVPVALDEAARLEDRLRRAVGGVRVPLSAIIAAPPPPLPAAQRRDHRRGRLRRSGAGSAPRPASRSA